MLGRSRFYVARDGLRLHMRDYDPRSVGGLPLICLPGLTRNADDFDPLARALAGDPVHPRRVVAFDYRGRGLSDRDPDWRRYTLAVEAADVRKGLSECGIEAAHFLGTSRGGLLTVLLAADHPTLVRSVVLNDIGPVLEPAGLERIKGYVGRAATPANLDEAIATLRDGTAQAFTELSEAAWRFYAQATFGRDPNALALRYDLALAKTLEDSDFTRPQPDLWPLFDRLAPRPLLVVRGGNSDLLSSATFHAMRTRWEGCEGITVAGQGHAPLLIDPTTTDAIALFLRRTETIEDSCVGT